MKKNCKRENQKNGTRKNIFFRSPSKEKWQQYYFPKDGGRNNDYRLVTITNTKTAAAAVTLSNKRKQAPSNDGRFTTIGGGGGGCGMLSKNIGSSLAQETTFSETRFFN